MACGAPSEEKKADKEVQDICDEVCSHIAWLKYMCRSFTQKLLPNKVQGGRFLWFFLDHTLNCFIVWSDKFKLLISTVAF